MGRVRRWAPAVLIISYLLATVIASLINHPRHPAILAPTPLLMTVLAGLVAAVTLGPLARRLRLAMWDRLVVLVVLIYALMTLSNEVEAVLFIKNAGLRSFFTGLVLAVGLGVPLALLWPPERADLTVRRALIDTLASRPWWSWLWRLVVAALVWVPVYLLFAAADAPFVHKYYADTGTPFTVPSGGVVASGELLRGVLHAVVLGCLAAIIPAGRRATWWWAALAFAVLNGWLPLIQRTDWPYYLRTANAIEITGDAAVYGAIVALLLIRKKPSH
jgi:hypothetical protein